MSLKELFAIRFAEFLRANFKSAEHVAICFDVSARTAQNWLDGTNTPHGLIVWKCFTDEALSVSAKKHMGDV